MSWEDDDCNELSKTKKYVYEHLVPSFLLCKIKTIVYQRHVKAAHLMSSILDLIISLLYSLIGKKFSFFCFNFYSNILASEFQVISTYLPSTQVENEIFGQCAILNLRQFFLKNLGFYFLNHKNRKKEHRDKSI